MSQPVQQQPIIKGYNLVGGQRRRFDATFDSLNPSTGEVIFHAPLTPLQDVADAVAAARKAQRPWRSLSRIKRAEYFERLVGVMYGLSDVLVSVISKETGKSLNESRAEFMESLHMAQYTFAQGREPFGKVVASEIAEKDVMSFRKPKGVVAVISPWNFPLAIGGFWTSAPALLEGNTVVFKPSEETPYVGWLIATLYEQAGFPEGVFNLVQGGSGIGTALVQSDVDHICFTGSAEVGQFIRRTCADSWHKTCSCELGSKSAVVVFDDAELDLAVDCCVSSAYKLSGQRCVSAGRLLVQRNVYAEFCERFLDASRKVTVGDPFQGDFFMGPLINQSQLSRVLKFNDMTHCDGVNVLLEGTRPQPNGLFLTPHVYACEWGDRPFLKQEVFGPHVAIVPFDTVEDAVRIYNDTDYGLSMSCITKDMYKARYMRDNCDFGLGYMNLPSIGASSHCSFSGVKKSGNGSPSAAGSFQGTSNEVTWTANYEQGGFQFEQGLK